MTDVTGIGVFFFFFSSQTFPTLSESHDKSQCDWTDRSQKVRNRLRDRLTHMRLILISWLRPDFVTLWTNVKTIHTALASAVSKCSVELLIATDVIVSARNLLTAQLWYFWCTEVNICGTFVVRFVVTVCCPLLYSVLNFGAFCKNL